MKFSSKVELGGKTATGIVVPDKVVNDLGSGKKPAVRVTINGHTYRSTVAPRGGKFLIPLSAENREAAGVAAGDTVKVDIELDTEKRELEIPADLTKALRRDAAAKKFFDGLSLSNKKRFVLPIEQAKAPETRQRRIDKTVEMCREGRV